MQVDNISLLIPILSGTNEQSLCNSGKSLGYSRLTSRTHPLEVLLVYLFKFISFGSIHLKPFVRRNLDIA